MASVWCVDPEEVTIDLVYTDAAGTEHPFWIRVRKELAVGEDRRVSTAGWTGFRQGTAADDKGGKDAVGAEIGIDWRKQTFARTMAYLMDWSLEDGEGATKTKLKISREVVEALRTEVYAVIEAGINKHVADQEAQKKPKPGK